MLCTWQVSGAANAQVNELRFVNASAAQVLLECPSCDALRVTYVRLVLPTTVTTWRLDAVWSNTNETQGVVPLACSTTATQVAEPTALGVDTWTRDLYLPGRPLPRPEAASLRLLIAPLPVAAWSATIDLDVFSFTSEIFQCRSE